MSLCHTPQDLSPWFDCLIASFDARTQGRFANLLHGVLFAQGRRTVSSWLRAAGVGLDFRAITMPCPPWAVRLRWSPADCSCASWYRSWKDPPSASSLVSTIPPPNAMAPVLKGPANIITPRRDRPAPSSAMATFGLPWRCLLRHPEWDTIALPLLAHLYVRAKDIGPLHVWYGWKFRTKLEQAADLIRWLATWAKELGRPLWLAMDGAYAKRPVLQAAKAAGVTVVSRSSL